MDGRTDGWTDELIRVELGNLFGSSRLIRVELGNLYCSSRLTQYCIDIYHTYVSTLSRLQT
jgi:hypothetical protein